MFATPWDTVFYKLWATLALNMPRCTKVTTTSPQRELGGYQTEPKGAKGQPKGAQGSTKAAQRSPKGSKKTPKREPRADPPRQKKQRTLIVIKYEANISFYHSKSLPIKPVLAMEREARF